MADDLLLEIVTPEKLIFSGKAEEVTVPGSEGEFGVLKGHAALLSGVDIGELSVLREKKKVLFALNSGFVEVAEDKVTILAETAERADLIDRERAKRAKERAESTLAKLAKEDNVEFEKAKAALSRAIVRIRVSEKL